MATAANAAKAGTSAEGFRTRSARATRVIDCWRHLRPCRLRPTSRPRDGDELTSRDVVLRVEDIELGIGMVDGIDDVEQQ
ncbi:MAG TPA: hypothetical protein VEJ44_03820, partial [Acidimicrobiales bacterium]|nr:hypothetical protein [Acidimicrobiales bacterium]